MKIKIDRKELSKMVAQAIQVVATSTTLESLKGILITAENNNIMVEATDQDNTLRLTTTNVAVEKEGKVLVEGKLLKSLTDKLPDTEILLEAESEKLLKLSAGSIKFDLNVSAADTFPEIVSMKEIESEVDLPREAVIEALTKTLIAASDDESKKTIMGVLIQLDAGELKTVGVDGFRLLENTRQSDSKQQFAVRIPMKSADKLIRIFSKESTENIKVRMSNKRMCLSTATVELSTRTIDGGFIDYKSILPTNFKTEIKFDRLDLITTLERVNVLASGNTTLVKMIVNDEGTTFLTRNAAGEVTETLTPEKMGANLEIGFNARYLIEGLKTLSDEKVTFSLNDASSAGILTGTNIKYLVLPVRMTATEEQAA